MADRRWHVGVDGRELVGKPTGVGRYISELLRVWARRSRFARISVFTHAVPDRGLRDDLGPGVEWVHLPGRGGLLWEQWQLARGLRAADVDVLFAGGYSAPLVAPCPCVVAIYDGSFWAHPEWFGPREGARRRFLARQAARRAAEVVTISEFSAREIVRFTAIPRTRITLAPPAARAPEPPSANAPDHPSTHAPEPMVLYVGSLFNRRHIPELVAGFARAVGAVPDARLVLVGDNRTRPHVDPIAEARLHGVADRVEWLAFVDDTALDALYRRARVFAFLSSYEGFAMTPLEALRHDVPSVLLDTEVAREVYGHAARLVSTDAAAIGDALTSLLVDEPTRTAVLQAGRPLLDRYSWTRSAETVADALERAAGSRR